MCSGNGAVSTTRLAMGMEGVSQLEGNPHLATLCYHVLRTLVDLAHRRPPLQHAGPHCLDLRYRKISV